MTTKNTEKSWREFLGEFLGNFNDHTLGMKISGGILMGFG